MLMADRNALVNGPDAASHNPMWDYVRGRLRYTSNIHTLNRKQCDIEWIQIHLYKFTESYSFICSDNHTCLR